MGAPQKASGSSSNRPNECSEKQPEYCIIGVAMAKITDRDIADFLVLRSSNAVSVTPYSQGVASLNFRAQGPDLDLTVRCDFRRTLEQIREDRQFIASVARTGVNVPDGSLFEGEVKGVATTVRQTVAGSCLTDIESEMLPPPAVIGKLLGVVHGATVPQTERRFFYSAFLDTEDQLWGKIDEAVWLLREEKALAGPMEVAHRRVKEASRLSSSLSATPLGLIHGDFNPPNLLLNPSSEITLIDWEKACFGPQIADVVQAVYYFSAYYSKRSIWFLPEFIGAYKTRRELDQSTLSAWLYYFPAFIFLRDCVSASIQTPGEVGAMLFERFQPYLRNDSAPRFLSFLANENRLAADLARV